MISDWELWACAQEVIRQHGAQAAEHAAERIDALEKAGDAAGVETWKRIARRIEDLANFRTDGRTRH